MDHLHDPVDVVEMLGYILAVDEVELAVWKGPRKRVQIMDHIGLGVLRGVYADGSGDLRVAAADVEKPPAGPRLFRLRCCSSGSSSGLILGRTMCMLIRERTIYSACSSGFPSQGV